jgi:hypothetical protein
MRRVLLASGDLNAKALLHSVEGSQIVEFAVSLPLLMVLIVGIFDFGSAFTVKLKVSNAALEGARIASSLPSADLSLAEPPSLDSVVSVVDNALSRANVNECALFPIMNPPAHAAGTLIWTYTANGNGCPGTLTLIIDRGFTYTAGLANPFPANYTVEATRVKISYPYKWQFNNVIKLMVPGATYAANTLITSTAVMQNLN